MMIDIIGFGANTNISVKPKWLFYAESYPVFVADCLRG